MQPPYYSLIDMIDLISTVSRRNETGYSRAQRSSETRAAACLGRNDEKHQRNPT